ncbi:hypothetical protein C1E24_07250, partial [Pseudoalteromonas phenolica]
GNDLTLTLNSVGATSSVLVDSIAPTVSSVSVPSNDTYIAGENLEFTVNTSENVTVDTTSGTPSIAITVGGSTKNATYVSGSGSSALTFRYTVESGLVDSDGITVGALSTNSGTLKDAAGNDLTLTLNSVGATTSVLVDSVAPTVSSVGVPSNDTYIAGENLEFTVNTSENVTVDTTSGTPSIAITVGSTTKNATYVSGSGSSALTFRYTVESGLVDSDGITVGALSTNSGTLKDAAGNDLTLTLNSVGATTSVLVDSVAPTVSSVGVPSNDTYIAGENLEFTVNTSENVAVVTTGGTPSIAITVGGSTKNATYVSGSGSSALTFRYTVESGLVDSDGITVGALSTNSGTLKDAAGNNLTLTLNNVGATSSVLVDSVVPSVSTFNASSLSLKSGETSQITIVLSESSSDFTIQDITITNGNLSDFSGSGSSYSATFTPSSNIENPALLDVKAGVFTDTAGNSNTASNQLSITIDTKAPSGQSVSIDQSVINKSNESALSFTLTGLESSGSFTYSITDGTSSVSSQSSTNITAETASIENIDVTNLNEGSLTLSVTVTDSAGNSAQAITDAVTKRYNVAPVLSGSPAASVNEDTEYNFTPTLTDSDTSDTHTFSITNKPSWASFDSQTGKLSGTPSDSDVGASSDITITVNDGTDSADLTAFSIEVINTNDAPVGKDFTFTLNEEATLTITEANGVLSTASDDDTDSGDTLKVNAVSQPQFGHLTLNTDGSFTYIHDGSENHSDSFTYQVVDSSNATSSTQTVTLTITPVADAPTTVNDTQTTNEDEAVTFNVLSNDSDPENDMVASSAAIATQPSKGSVSIANGVVTYTPNANENGQDSFTYTVKDAALNTSAEATVSITIKAVNDQPTVQNFTTAIDEDNASDAIAVRAGSIDVEDGTPSGDITLASQPSKGSVAIDQNAGTLVYTPNANETGSDTFTYTITDSEGSTSESATVSVTIGAVNDKPIVANDSVTTDEDVNVTLSVLDNDSDVEDQGFNGANITLEDQGNGAGTYTKADVSILTDGRLQISPKQDENGSFSFTYTLTDSEGLTSDPATVTVTLTPVNDAPVAVANTAEVAEEGSFEVNVLGNDTDVDENDSFNASSVTVVQAPSSGQTQITSAGAIVYTPNENFAGEDTFTYTVSDAAGAVSNEATVTMTVTPVNDTPVISGSPATTVDEDSIYSFTPTSSDVDGDTLTFSIQNMPQWASFDTSTGTLSGTPSNDDVGTYQGIEISVTDGTETASLTSFDITVINTNDAPTISGTPASSVDEDTTYSFTPVANDVDSEDTLTFSITNQPSWANFDSQTGTLSGTPENDHVGTTSDITISVNDGTETTELTPFSITVVNTNDTPVISGIPSSSIDEDTAYSFVPTASDVDVGDTLTFSVTNLPKWASFSTSTGAISGTPGNSDVGVYQGIVISVSDGTEKVNLDAFNVTVVNVNDAPVIVGTPSTSVNEDSAYSFTPTASDIDGDSLTFSISNKPTWASFDEQTGTLSGIPVNADVGSSNDIVISVSDGAVSVSLDAFSLSVINTNDAPVISGTPATSVNEDSLYSFTPSASDVDVGDVLTFSINNKPSWANFDTTTGVLSGTPADANVGSQEQIVITVSDGTVSQSLNAFNLEVINTNDAPTAQDYTFSLDEGQLLTVTEILGLLSTANDDDLDSNDSLSVTEITQPQYGQLTLNTDGSFSYQHDGGESTSDSFTFEVTDVQNASSGAHNVSLTINPVADAPITQDDIATTNEDTAIQIDLLENDSDAEDDLNAASTVVVTKPTKGTVSIVNGIATYTPSSNENGQDSFTYTVADTGLNVSEQATVVVTITPINDAPVAANLTISTDEDTSSTTLDIRAAATDVEEGIPTGTIALVNSPNVGLVVFDQDAGTVVYTPNSNEVGEDSFTYTIADNEGVVSSPATVSVNIGAINDRPVVGDDSVTTDEDVTVTLNILSNDSDVEDQGFNGANITLEDQGNGSGIYDKASVSVLADGTLEIAPNQDQTGTFSFTYTLTDSEGLTSLPATVTATLTPVNDAPVAVDNSVELQEEGAFEINVLGNDTDIDEGDSFDVSSVTVVSAPQNGQAEVTAEGTIIYTANTNYFGDDSFTYTVKDQAGAVSNEATVLLSVTPINDAPEVEAQALTLNEDDTLLVTLSGTDIDADALTYSIVSDVASGTLEQQAETTWLYTPNANFNGSDSFSFMANDGTLDSNIATFTLTINAVNDTPVISGSPETTAVHNNLYSFTPQATDIENDTLTFSISNQPAWAEFDIATGTLSGTPSREDEGVYSNIVISVSDGDAQAALNSFDIEVQFVNNQPMANDMAISVNEDGTTSFTADTSDEDGDTVTISISRQPVSGTLVLQGSTFTYTPLSNFNGLDSFSYIANDGSIDSSAGEVNITVNAVNDLPLAVNDSFIFESQANNTYTFDVLANDTDADEGDVLTIIGAKASVGAVSIVDSELSYQAEAETQGLIVIDYLIEDSQKARSKATAQLQINSAPVNTLPVVSVPADVTANATGLFTKVALGTATATDSNGNSIAVSLVDGTTLFAPGAHFVYWQATDSQGLQSIATQNVFVNPLVSLEKNSDVAEDQNHTVSVFLNGPAPSYPVTVPYTVSGTATSTDHDLVDGQISIESGTSAQISFNVFADSEVEGNESIIITLGDALNKGAKSSTTVTIVEENVAPTVTTEVVQAGEVRSLLTINDDVVTVTATAKDANPQDNVSLTWNLEGSELTNLSTEQNTFVFSTSELAEGIYQLTVTATDDADPSLSSVSEVYLEVVAELQSLTQEDTDGDLIPDDQEGYADSDGDGIPDFQDAITDCNVMQEQATESNQFLVEGEPGVCLRKGATVAQNSTGGVQLLESELPSDESAINIGGLFDFIATGLPQAGDTYSIVIPQRRPIPLNAVYRKLKADEWIDFVSGNGNQILSATGEPGYCPPPGSNEWTEGLTEGDWCVQLQIVDGGPNDDDGIANRAVVDPGGIAVPKTSNNLPQAQSDEVTIRSGEAIIIDVLNNDSDADDDTLTITGASVDFGSVIIEENKLVYTPPTDLIGQAIIQYSISDGKGGTSNSTATVNLIVNNAPTAVLDIASTNDKASITIDVLANDTDKDGDKLTLVSATAQHGDAQVNLNGTLTYVPKVGFNGIDVIKYSLKDSKGAVSQGEARVTVTAHQSVAIENKSSGSLGGAVIIMISILLMRRRKALLPSFALITSSCLISSETMASDWGVEAGVGQAKADYSMTNVDGVTEVMVDDSSNSWSAGVYYQLTSDWSTSLRYIDLGQGRVSFKGESLTPDSVHQRVAEQVPSFSEGFALQAKYNFLTFGHARVGAFLGAYKWQYKVESVRDNQLIKSEMNGTDLYYGIGMSYALTDSLSVQLDYSHFNLEPESVSDLQLGLSYRF